MTRGLAAIAVVLALAGAGLAQPGPYEPPRIDDGTRVEPSTPRPTARPPAQQSATDKRPFMVAGGLVVLGALFVWNRRRRAELERESEDVTRNSRARARAARGIGIDDAAEPPDDADSTDLRAAARGDDAPPEMKA